MRKPICAVLTSAIALTGVVLGTGTAGAVGTPTPDVVLNFEADAVGAKPNGFTSAGSPFVHFSDTNGADLQVGGFGTQGEGTRSLAVFGDFDDSALRITLDRPTNRISMRFGNDDPNFSDPGDEAVLQVFRGTALVGERRVTMNRNDVMDQTISFVNGPLFTRAVFKYDVDPAKGLIEVVDQITLGPLCTVAGTEASETLLGTAGNDVICGGGGNDTIFGRGGNDHISGGNGDDSLNGEAGEDFIAGNFGNDTVKGGDAADTIEGGEQDDRLFGDAGPDVLKGGPGNDRCDGGTQSDTAAACETVVNVP